MKLRIFYRSPANPAPDVMLKRLTSGSIAGAFALMIVLGSSRLSFAAQEEDDTIKSTLPLYKILDQSLPKGEHWFGNYFYDLGRVVQGSRRGHWSEMTGEAGYRHGHFTGYGSFTHHRRLGDDNYTTNAGIYFKLKNFYFHEEFGKGWNVSYIYKIQNLFEVSHPLYKNLHWQMGYIYRQYKKYGTHIVRPGLIYYFGDHYISADYGITAMERRGTGQHVSVKANIALIKNLRLSGGFSAGEWLYDIYGYSARKETGYIGFVMLDYRVLERLNLRAGYSYGTEKPKFIKRSIMLSASVKI